MLRRRSLTKEQALQKLKHFCGYQERCHNDVRERLFQLGVRRSDQDEIMATLIEENYLNEERFAIAFARGKFRMNEWGRIKIKAALKQKKISDYCINKALKQIEEKEYLQLLKKLSEKRYAFLKREQYLVRKKKTMDYLLQKGFERELVKEAVEPK